jgi:hypothetical protein
LKEDAYARRVEALVRAAGPEAGRGAAREYLEAFPGGRYVADVNRWVGFSYEQP